MTKKSETTQFGGFKEFCSNCECAITQPDKAASACTNCGTKLVPDANALRNALKFCRLSFGATDKGPTYAVELNGLSIGTIEATTPSRYPGRSKATYNVFPDNAQGCQWDKSLGKAASRPEAADLILAHLRKFAYGRKLIEKATY